MLLKVKCSNIWCNLFFFFSPLFSYYIYVNTEILLYLRPHWKIILCPLLLMMMLILAHSNGSITCISFTNNVNTLVLQTKKECNVASLLGFPRVWLTLTSKYTFKRVLMFYFEKRCDGFPHSMYRAITIDEHL